MEQKNNDPQITLNEIINNPIQQRLEIIEKDFGTASNYYRTIITKFGNAKLVEAKKHWWNKPIYFVFADIPKDIDLMKEREWIFDLWSRTGNLLIKPVNCCNSEGFRISNYQKSINVVCHFESTEKQ